MEPIEGDHGRVSGEEREAEPARHLAVAVDEVEPLPRSQRLCDAAREL
jgi:hypothetical protein